MGVLSENSKPGKGGGFLSSTTQNCTTHSLHSAPGGHLLSLSLFYSRSLSLSLTASLPPMRGATNGDTPHPPSLTSSLHKVLHGERSGEIRLQELRHPGGLAQAQLAESTGGPLQDVLRGDLKGLLEQRVHRPKDLLVILVLKCLGCLRQSGDHVDNAVAHSPQEVHQVPTLRQLPGAIVALQVGQEKPLPVQLLVQREVPKRQPCLHQGPDLATGCPLDRTVQPCWPSEGSTTGGEREAGGQYRVGQARDRPKHRAILRHLRRIAGALAALRWKGRAREHGVHGDAGQSLGDGERHQVGVVQLGVNQALVDKPGRDSCHHDLGGCGWCPHQRRGRRGGVVMAARALGREGGGEHLPR
eukprot:RCo033283